LDLSLGLGLGISQPHRALSDLDITVSAVESALPLVFGNCDLIAGSESTETFTVAVGRGGISFIANPQTKTNTNPKLSSHVTRLFSVYHHYHISSRVDLGIWGFGECGEQASNRG
jgi:hypothetical protein